MLLDTHIFLWWLFNDAKLPQNIKLFVQDRNNQVFVSAVSAWEITTKFRLGKLPEAALVAKDVPLWIIKAGFEPLPVTPVHAQLAGEWDFSHRDPFDRMLAAQAKLERMPLASVDPAFGDFPIEIFR
ncbi:MAG: twitching motility protein PilT [Deltaproteobacteria bacterium RIFOXYD12_FULL_50_9]|nr:MAG: twitching motility protein PilT [Deltaproteobacteria bacterium RIFOXYD12_FULL_50_9]